MTTGHVVAQKHTGHNVFHVTCQQLYDMKVLL